MKICSSYPGLSLRSNPGIGRLRADNPERVRQLREPLQGFNEDMFKLPSVVAALQPWAEISERLRRSFANAFAGI
jgi:hypothetical protein